MKSIENIRYQKKSQPPNAPKKSEGKKKKKPKTILDTQFLVKSQQQSGV